MRILLLTETVPYPLDSGGRIKTFNTLRMLSGEHEVHCFAFIRDEGQRSHLAPLRQACASVTLELLPRSPARELHYALQSLLTGRPYTVIRHFHPGSLASIERVAGKGFDAVYADHLSMFEYARRLGLPVIHDAHNVESEVLRRYGRTRRFSPIRPLLAREWRLVRRYERAAYRESALVCAVSEQDARAIRALAGREGGVRVVPIAIDALGVTPRQTVEPEPRLLFVGGLHWPPNRDAVLHFVREVWPRVRTVVPSAQLTVVGREDALVARILRQAPGVTVTGYVDDVGPFFAASRAMVVPLRAGSGMRVKILDAFALGLPVVSTPVGHEGIEVRPGVHLLSAAGARRFAEETVRVLTDDRLAAVLAAEARRLAVDRYDVRVVRKLLLDAVGRVRSPGQGADEVRPGTT